MKPFYLSEITTADGLVHQGLFFKPTNPKKRAILWVHGLTGRFYGDPEKFEHFTQECEAHGFGFAAFNNRGHDQVTGMHRIDPKTGESGYAYGGGGREVFEECVFDIAAGVDFLVKQGFPEVILIGHSTGSLKVAYSEGTKPHKNVIGLVVAGPISDRLGPDIDHKKLPEQISRMEALIAAGKGDELVNGLSFFPMTPKRFLSFYKKGLAEEAIVDYGDAHPTMTAFSAIKKPMLVVFSEKDENLDRPAVDVKKVFDAKTTSKNYKSIVVPGVDHEFSGKEKEVVATIVSWVASI